MKTLMLALPVTLVLATVTHEPAVAMPGDQLRASLAHSLRTAGVDDRVLSRLTTSQLTRLNFIFQSDESEGNMRFHARTYLDQTGR